MIALEKEIIIINFLNEKAINLLYILAKKYPITSVNLRNKVIKNEIMSISSYYRYLDFLLKHKLIKKEKYRKKTGGYIYNISNFGKYFLELILKSNIPFYNNLNHDLNS